MAANTTNKGAIKIAIVSSGTFSGSGPIAVVSFGSTKGSGALTIVSANMISPQGTPVNAGISSGDAGSSSAAAGPSAASPATSATGSTGTPASSSAAATSTAGTAAAAIPVYAGTVTMPVDAAAQAAPKPAETPSISAAEAAPQANATTAEHPVSEKTVEPKQADTPRSITYTAALERFRTFHGSRTPAALIALFGADMPKSISQTPAVVLSDGTTHVRITVTLAAPDGHSPNFALNGAKLISLARGEQPDTWIVEALPQRDTLKASLTILNGTQEILFPLAVSPPVKSKVSSESDFAAFLKNSGKTADLNKDGKRDYIDDYIYTANYLARKAAPSKTPAAHKKQ